MNAYEKAVAMSSEEFEALGEIMEYNQLWQAIKTHRK